LETSPLGIAIVGLRFGKYLLELLHQEPASNLFHLTGVCDLQESLVTEMADKYGATGYRSLDELLEKDSSPIIGLFTPPKGRANLVRKIIRAGRDVLTTKPFELDHRAAQEVLEEARSLGRVVHLNSPAPQLPDDLQLVEDWRKKYSLGRAVGGEARTWCSYHEKADGSWMDNPATCPAAPLFRLGIYLFNDFHTIFGPAESVQLMTSSLRTGRPTPDNAQLNIKYQSGALGHVFASFCVEDGDRYQNSLVLNFERGTIYRNAGGIRGPRDHEKAELILVVERNDRREVVEQAVADHPSGKYQWPALAAAVRERHLASDAYISDIVAGVRLVDALDRAQLSGVAQV
jgi:predicted dehydrogenase